MSNFGPDLLEGVPNTCHCQVDRLQRQTMPVTMLFLPKQRRQPSSIGRKMLKESHSWTATWPQIALLPRLVPCYGFRSDDRNMHFKRTYL